MAAFPDMTIRVESMIAEGDRVALLCWATGTHRGDFAGIPATRRSVIYQVVVMDRLQDGKIVQHNASPDLMAVLVQLGRSRSNQEADRTPAPGVIIVAARATIAAGRAVAYEWFAAVS
jgi:hypothetical protein